MKDIWEYAYVTKPSSLAKFHVWLPRDDGWDIWVDRKTIRSVVHDGSYI